MTGKNDPTIKCSHLMVDVLVGRKVNLKGGGGGTPFGRRGLRVWKSKKVKIMILLKMIQKCFIVDTIIANYGAVSFIGVYKIYKR